MTKPTDTSSFGKKIAEREWRAFNANLVEKGTVTTVEYERGFEVIKDGKHWFYDIENMDESDLQFRMEVGAAESVLHPGVWEPVWIDRTMLNNIAFYFIYRCGWEGIEGFYISEREQAKLKIYDGGDARLSTRNFN